MTRENDLEGQQDQGGKHGGQAGMPKPERSPSGKKSPEPEQEGRVVGDPRVRKSAGRSE